MSTTHPTRPSPTVRRPFAAALLIIGIALSLVVSLSGVSAAPPAPTAAATAALDWQAAQLTANGGTMPGFSPGSTDWGLTADTILAFAAAGRTNDPAAITATDALGANANIFTTWAPADPNVREAGATGKTLLALLAMGRSSTVGGTNLETELRSLIVATGAQAGRFSDRVPDPAWDSSNGFGQALSMMALSLTPGGVPDAAVTYLLAQQCPAGGFRLSYTGPACSIDGEADTDATALSLQALLPLTRTPQVAASLDRAVAWLLARQTPAGAFAGTGPTALPNANSTGLSAQALRAAGQTAAADKAAAWIVSTSQLTAAGTANSPAASHVGAIGYGPSAVTTALAGGITTQTGDQWRRATSQAVLGLGLAPYGPPNSAPVVPGSSTIPTTTVIPGPTSTTSAPASTSTTPGSTTSTTSTTSATSTTSTSSTTSTTSPPNTSTTSTDVRVESAVLNSSSDRSATQSGSGLAITGGSPAPLAAAALIVTGAGFLVTAAAVAGARRRRA